MLTIFLFAVLFLSFNLSTAQNCTDCVASGSIWCKESTQCNSTFLSCPTQITLSLNCPRLPDPQYAYDDNLMRTQHIVFATATQGDLVQTCFDNQIPTMKLLRAHTVDCAPGVPNVTCRGFTAYDVTQKVIVLAFRGSIGAQTQQLDNSFANEGIRAYPGIGGKFFKGIYDSFMFLWNGGMQQDLRSLKYMYPGFQLWINGHSLGGMLAWVTSSYIVSIGLYKPENIRVVAMGSPRVGDYEFAEWYTATFPYSYHIVHRLDSVPRSLRINPNTNSTLLYHARTQVWYNNYMNLGDPFEICVEADGPYCSDAIQDNLNLNDHLYYFNVNILSWGRAGCPKNREPYAQP